MALPTITSKGGVPAPAAERRVVLNWFEELKAGTRRR